MQAWKFVAILVLVGWLILGLNTMRSNAQRSQREQATNTDHGSADESPPAQAQTGKPEKEEGGEAVDSASFWMTQKLRLSKDVLAGLASADFDAILKNASMMRGLNRVEAFARRKPAGYRDQLRSFNMANNSLIQAAKDENLEGATLAFNQMTISCMRCHQQLRDLESKTTSAKK